MPNKREHYDLTQVKEFALPDTAGASTQSTGVDLGADVFKPEAVELVLDVPAMTATMVPDTKTVTLTIESSTTSVFTAVARTLAAKTVTAASSGSLGLAAMQLRCRLPADCERYVRGKVTLGAGTADSSALSATFKPTY